jgi:hypothetical protein
VTKFRNLIVIPILLLAACSAFASVAVSVNVRNIATTAPTTSITVRFQLQNCTGNVPRVISSGVIVQAQYDFKPDAAGLVTGTIFGNDEIDCGGYQNSVYAVIYLKNGIPLQPSYTYLINAESGTFNPATAVPTSSVPAVYPPDGDTTYLRLDGGNASSGSTPLLNALTSATRLFLVTTTIADAATACGTTLPCHVVIPSTYSGTECPAISTNIFYDDFRAGGRSGSGTSSFICTTNVAQYNTITPGFTDAMLRSEMKRTSVHADGSIVSLYPLTHLSNATVSGTGTTVDGAAPEAQIEGTLSGTLPYLHGSENTATILSTGGTVGTASGAIGLVFSSAGSTTAVTNAYGLWGKGCNGTIAGAAPTYCYGVFADRQIGAASSGNWALGVYGKARFLYDSNIGAGGFDADDVGGTPRSAFYVASDNSTNFQAVNALGGFLRDSLGASQLSWTASGAKLTNTLNANSNNITNVAALTASGTVTAGGFVGTGAPKIASGSASNTDVNGILTLAAGTVTYTFVNTYSSAPICFSKDNTTPANATVEVVTTTTLTITGTGTDDVKYICIGRN